jgi:hypothetical protein
MIMLENNKELFWFGSSGHLSEQPFPIAFDFSKYMPDLFIDPNADQGVNDSGGFNHVAGHL